MDNSGIYKITNLITMLFYIGSTINFRIRWNNHKNNLRNNKHDNSKLQRSWNKYGEDKFQFEIIEECEKEKLIEREQYWLDETKCYERNIGYNLCPKSGNTLGRKHTNQTKKVLSLLAKKRKINGSVLNEYLAKKIRDDYYSGDFTQKELSKKYNIKMITINKVIKYESWNRNISQIEIEGRRKLREEISLKNHKKSGHKGENNPNAKINFDIAQEIRKKYKTGNYSYPFLAKLYSVGIITIYEIVKNKRWVQ